MTKEKAIELIELCNSGGEFLDLTTEGPKYATLDGIFEIDDLRAVITLMEDVEEKV